MTRLHTLPLRLALFFALLIVGSTLNTAFANEPDSLYLFAYSRADGTGGLRFAYSIDGSTWLSLSEGYSFLSSDFGSWGKGKKMFHPQVFRSRADGSWHCLFAVSRTDKALAYCKSEDLTRWTPQTYFDAAELDKYMPTDVYPTEEKHLIIGRDTVDGYAQRTSRSVVDNLIAYAGYKKYRSSLHAERMAQDPERFAQLKPVEADIKVNAEEAKDISTHLIGIFFEDINYAADGGLYAELIQNRDFEYKPSDSRNNPEWNSTHSWTLSGEGSTLSIDTVGPVHANNPHYAVLTTERVGASLVNAGYDGIAVKAGELYDLSLFTRQAGGKSGKMKVALLTANGEEIGSATLTTGGSTWKKRTATLTARADEANAVLSLTPLTEGVCHIDVISLFPRHTFKGRKNGLRADLAQALADLHPRFVRFPGGCVAHGDGVDNIYDWKGSIGPIEARKPLPNIWRYHQTRGLGYHEYFCFCEDIGAEPLPVLAAGVPCQNSSTPSHHSADELTAQGQQQGIPMEEMDAYIQDVLDLIEYANGDARQTTWGKQRAANGHPQPFNLKYIGIGNEDLISDVFEERFRLIYQAVRERYPEITVVGTVGPFYEGSDYDRGWQLATELQIPIVDEHYYVEPGWLIHNGDYYDRYDRSKSKVYLGEYASHVAGRANNMETALTLALYLTSVERNADVVEMSSYAPLLAKEGHTQWRPDLIFFNNTSIRLTTDYYVQQLYGQYAGSSYLPSTIKLNNDSEAVRHRIGVSVVGDGSTYYVRLANLLPIEVSSTIDISSIGSFDQEATAIVLSGEPQCTDAKPTTTSVRVEGGQLQYSLPAYSFTVIRLAEVKR